MSIVVVALSPVQEESLNFPGSAITRYGPRSGDSILIYLSVAGSMMPMHLMESDSIASVKLRIQSVRGFFVKRQKLVLGGRELARNNSHIRDYGVADGNILHLVLWLSNVLTIAVRTVSGKEYEFQVEKNRDVAYLKKKLAHKEERLVDLKDQELVCDGEELEDQRLLYDICRKTDAVIHLLVRKSAKVRAKPVQKHFEVVIDASDVNDLEDAVGERVSVPLSCGCDAQENRSRDFLLEAFIANGITKLPCILEELISSTSQGLWNGNEPVRASEGSGGAYFMKDYLGEKYISVFKPIDEEPLAVNNPRGLPLSINGEGLEKGTRVGEGALREVAAFLLDHPLAGPRHFNSAEKGFSGVPPTLMIKCLHRGFNYPQGFVYTAANIKIGSLQIFVQNNGSCEDMGPCVFPVNEVHKISVLDIRLANADRHAGNILISEKGEDREIVLTPIDHGYCVPENFEDCTFDWLYWPQAHQAYSPQTIDYINLLDAEKDIQLLKSHGWELPTECAQTLRISTMLLKKGVEKGLTPSTIGSIMCRKTLKEESAIEVIVREAREALIPESSEVAFLESVSDVMDQFLERLYTTEGTGVVYTADS